MLGKLMKYDLRQNFRNLLPVFIIVIAMSVLSSAGLFAFIKMVQDNGETVFESAIGIILMIYTFLTTFLAVIAICCSLLVAGILLIKRFYDSTLSDEGYLTHTLPVSTHQILISKILSNYICIVVSVIVALAAAIIVYLGVRFSLNAEALSDISWGFREAFTVFKDLYEEMDLSSASALTIINIVLSPIYAILYAFFCFQLGAYLAPKHKVLCAIGVYIASNMIISMASSAYSTARLIVVSQQSFDATAGTFFNGTLVFSLILQVVLGAVFYWICHYLMSKRLNLE